MPVQWAPPSRELLRPELLDILNGVALGMLIFILAIGLSLIFGMLDVINLAHGSLYLLGTYLGYELVENQRPAVHPRGDDRHGLRDRPRARARRGAAADP